MSIPGPASVKEPTAHPRPRLLIADDDPVVQIALSASLGTEFDVVGVAADGEGAIELARVSQPDVAIVDVEMPKGGGLSAVHGIVEVAPGTAIVMLSSDESENSVRELIEAGAILYRRKGLSHDVLVSSLTDSMAAHPRGRRGGS